MSTATPASRRRGLGLPLATALVVGNMIGSGVFLLPASLASYGGISIVGWMFTAVGAFFLAYCFARMSRAYPQTGGPYVYSRRAFGDFIGFQTAWGYWLAAWIGNAAIATAFVGYLGYFIDPLAGSTTADHVLQAAVAIGAIVLLTAVNLFGVRQGGLMQGVTTVLKVLPLLAIAFVGIFWFASSNFPPFNASGGSNFSAINSVAALTLWAFIGLESATVPAESVEDPKKNVTRATLIGTIATAVVYILGTVAVMGILPMETLRDSTAPFADAARSIWGDWAGGTVALGAIFATFGCLNGWILLTGQMPFAAARDRLFPAPFARLNKFGVPAVGIVVSSVLLSLYILPSYNSSTVARFTDFIYLATTTTLIAYLYGVGSRMVLLVTDRAANRVRSMLVEMSIATLAVAYALWAIFGAGYRYATWGALVTFAGIPLYAWLKSRPTAEAEVPEVTPKLPEDMDAALAKLAHGERVTH
jgi:APA family basic amino acid/polyamine antiporter